MTDEREVTEEQARELANELGINLFMETSAKVNEGVEEAFFTLARFVHPFPHPAVENLAYTMTQGYQDTLV